MGGRRKGRIFILIEKERGRGEKIEVRNAKGKVSSTVERGKERVKEERKRKRRKGEVYV